MYHFGDSPFNRVNFVSPLQESNKWLLQSTFQFSSLRFLHDVQISMSRPYNINVFQWNKECFFLRHEELNSTFTVMTIDEITLDRPQIGMGFSVICGFCLEWVLGIRSLSLTILLFHLWMGRRLHHLFDWSLLPLHWFSDDKYLMHPTFPSLPRLLSKYHLSKFPTRSAHSQERFLVIPSCHIDDLLFQFFTEIRWYSTNAPKSIIGPLNGSPNRLSFGVFSISQQVLDVSQTAIAFHGVWPPPCIWS